MNDSKRKQLPFVSLISSSLAFMYAKSVTMSCDKSSNLLSSTSNGLSFSTLASFWNKKFYSTFIL